MNQFEKMLGPEYKFLDTDPRLGENIHLLVYGGSKAYGTNLPTSDTDIRGIATNTAENILSGTDFEVFTNEKTDTVIYSLEKIFTLLKDCNPNTIEMLFVREEDVLFADEIGKMILNNRHLFLSNKCIKTFGGYANSQLYRLRQKTLSALTAEQYAEHIAKTIQGMKDHLYQSYGIDSIDIVAEGDHLTAHISDMVCPAESFANILNEINTVIRSYHKTSQRNEKALVHNKISKHAMHLVRLYLMAIELLSTGSVSTYRDKEHDLLMFIRNGEYCQEDGQMDERFFHLVAGLEQNFEEAKKGSVLPDTPDMEAIKRLKIKINLGIVQKIQKY